MVGHLRPAVISHIVDITVSAVDVAATGNLNQNGIYLNHVLGLAGGLIQRERL